MITCPQRQCEATDHTQQLHLAFMNPNFVVPEDHDLIYEAKTPILVPKAQADGDQKAAFLNPIQEFNRDLSICAITTFLDQCTAIVKERVARRNEKHSKRRQANGDTTVSAPEEFKIPKYAILEALSATGLRAIRYAKEIPDVSLVMANDMSPSAVEAIRQNVLLNNIELGESAEAGPSRIQITQMDACDLMYSRRPVHCKVQVVDLDPYGTAAPFIDAAIQSVRDGGLICITCTDLAVLAGHNYPEKCFANYGGVSLRSDFSHEFVLRLVLNMMALTASRYGKAIQPLLSLSIDFYVRLFVKVVDSPLAVKKQLGCLGPVHICTECFNYQDIPFGRVVEESVGQVKIKPGQVRGSERCDQCSGVWHMAGPVWLGPLHDPTFTESLLHNLDTRFSYLNTRARIHGMVTLARDEIPNAPFYFLPARLAGLFHSQTPSFLIFASALIQAGYKVSRTHALGGALKTNAPRRTIYDIFRAFIKSHPVDRSKYTEDALAYRLLSREAEQEYNFNIVAEARKLEGKNEKITRYQHNPLPNWGPQKRAKIVGRNKNNATSESTTELQNDSASH